MVCELTQMDISNASMYDGATSTAEAMFMAHAQTQKNEILVSSTLNPKIIDVIKTYARYRNLTVTLIPNIDGVTDLNFVKENINDKMGVIVANPNYFGIIEDYDGLADIIP